LGDWWNLNELLEEGINLGRYPILGFLINQDFGYQESKEGYVSKCHLCVDIRKHLLTKQKFEELKPKEFYFYLE